MREILFKAKRIDNGEWVEGNLIQSHYMGSIRSWISSEQDKTRLRVISSDYADWRAVEVDTKTLCQYTGLTEKNGRKIWENDIIKGTFWGFMMPVENYIFKISWHDGVAGWCRNVMDDDNEVIGNIFDNPELLEGGAE